ELQAIAQPEGVPELTGPMAAFAPPPTLGPVVPGQRIEVRVALTNRGTSDIEQGEIALVAAPDWRIQSSNAVAGRLGFNQTARQSFAVTVPDRAPFTRPYFERASLADSRYAGRDMSQIYRPAAEAALTARARYRVE